MQRFIVSLAASVCLVALGAASPAGAAGFISFVSDTGTDTGTCGTLGTACRQITFALTQTNEGGIIHVLPGEYDAFAPDKSIEVVADAGQASIFSTTVSDAGIAVTVSGTSAVRLRGFHISAANGILINGGGGVVHIENCTILPAEIKTGIVYAPTGSSELYVSDTTISGSGNPNAGGISIKPTGSGSAKVVLDNVDVEDNASGMLIDGRTTTGSNTVTIRNSTLAGNTTQGLNAIDSGGGTTSVMIEGATFSNNGSQGVVANGANVTVRVRNSTMSGNGRGVQAATGAQIISHGGNVVAGNTVNGVFSSSVGQQ